MAWAWGSLAAAMNLPGASSTQPGPGQASTFVGYWLMAQSAISARGVKSSSCGVERTRFE
jgi:hypothetical protein